MCAFWGFRRTDCEEKRQGGCIAPNGKSKHLQVKTILFRDESCAVFVHVQ